MKIKKPETCVNKSEVSLCILTGVVAFLCTVPIPAPVAGDILNAPILAALPLQVAILAWVLPIGMYFGFMVSAQIRFNDRVKEHYAKLEQSPTQRIIFRSHWREHGSGTLWEVRNCNCFVWTNVELLIEKRVGERLENEKQKVGVLASGERFRIESRLSNEETAQWRLMVVCAQGSLIDFPDQWIDPAMQYERVDEEELAGV